MELACALVLLIIGSVTASPYGYGSFGPKGGAVAKADAHAVAGAYAGPGSLPLSIPGSDSFSGSFTQSSASSSSSSSASSGSFSYSGTGTSGGVLPGANGCGFGKCNTGGPHGSPGITGPQSHSGVDTHFAGGYGGKIPSGSYGHKYDNGEKWAHTGGSNEDSDEDDSDGEYDDINVHATGTTNSKSSYAEKKPGCSYGNCSPPPFLDSHSPFGYSKPTLDLTAPKLDPPCSEPHCHKSTSGYSSPTYNKSPYYTTSFQKEHFFGYVPSSGNGFFSKPSYAHGGYSPVQSPSNPSGPTTPGYHGSSSSLPAYSHGSTPFPNPSGCVPGNPGCISSHSVSSDCTSGNCGTNSPGYSSSPGIKPNYSHGSQPSYSSVKPPNLACTPGTLGCPTSQSGASCKFGNCGGYPTSGYEAIGNKPSYSHGNSPLTPSGPGCAPGIPGCESTPLQTSPSGCKSGKCYTNNPTTPEYNNFSNIKPGNSFGTTLWGKPIKYAGSCTPGTPSCGITQQTGSYNCVSGNCGVFPSLPGYGGPSNVKPSYSQEGPYSTATPSVSGCAPGTFGCSSKPAINVPYTPTGCTSGNCETYPSSAGNSFSSIQPSVSYDSLSSHAQKPLKPLCIPGSRGCSLPLPPGATSGCTSSHCGEFSPPGQETLHSGKPSYSPGSSSNFPQNPLGTSCIPGTPGCASIPPSNTVSGCTSGKCGSHSSHGCAPGSPGCSGLPSSLHSGSQNVLPGLSTITTSTPVSGGSSYGSSYPSSQSVSSQSGVPSTTTEASEKHDKKEDIPYTGGFGGPAGILKPHEYSFSPFPSSGHKPTMSTAPITAKPDCVSGICNTQGVSSLFQSGVASDVHAGSGQHITSGIPTSSGIYNTGSNTPFIKPAPIMPSATGSVSGIGSSTQTGVVGSLDTANAQNGGNEGVPYTGGFGGPGISSSGYGSSSAGSSGQQAGSGIYNIGSPTPFIKPVPIIPSAAGSASSTGSSTQTGAAGSTATANAQRDENAGVPYTGGFGGPAGIYKPTNEFNASPIPSSGHKPTTSTPATTVKPDCVSGICNSQGFSSLSQSGAASGVHAGSGQDTTSGISTSGYSSPDAVSSGQPVDSGIYNTGSRTPFIKPAPIIPSATVSASGIGSSTQTGVVGSSDTANAQNDENKGVPYTGGFGGPAEVFKPNENSASPIPVSGQKPTISTAPITAKPDCVSGICNIQGSSSLSQSVTDSDAHAGTGQHTTSGISTSVYGSSSTGSAGQQAVSGISNTGSQTPFIKPAPIIPSATGSAPGIGSSSQMGVPGPSVTVNIKEDQNEGLLYTGGFGGPAGILNPNEYSIDSIPSSENEPIKSTSPTTERPNCVSGICNVQGSSALSQSGTASDANPGSGQQATTEPSIPGQGVSGAVTSIQDAAFGFQVAGSPFLKPAPVRPSTSISVPSVGFSTQAALAVSGTMAGASNQRDGKNDPPYIGGFGGPSGLLKPSENNPVSTLNLGNTPTVSSTLTIVKTNCDTGICEGQEAPSLSNSESSSGAQAAAAASASADAVAYTGGFGGPPGFLKPNDNNKATNNGANGVGSSSDLNQGVDAVDNLNDLSQLGKNTVAQATAAAVSSAGASSVDNKFNSENQGGDAVGTDSSAGGCAGGCGGSGSGSHGYSASLGFTKTLNGVNNGLASAGAVATSVANAASSGRAFGSSFASSSASAHAGASIKGGYGRR